MNEPESALAREEKELVADCFPPLFSVLRESLRGGEAFSTLDALLAARPVLRVGCSYWHIRDVLLRCVDTARRLGLDAYAYRVPFVNVLSHPYRWRYWVREKLALYWGYFRSLTGRG